MNSNPSCKKCNSENVYSDGSLWICPECSHEWSLHETVDAKNSDSAPAKICDAHGNVLKDGDSVTVIKDLKIKGASSVVKAGTKVKNIRLIEDASDGHDIACRLDGLGQINLKSEFLKKA